MNGEIRAETQAGSRDRKLSLLGFVLGLFGVLSAVFAAAMGYMMVSFQNATTSMFEREIETQWTDSTTMLTQVFDRFVLLGQQLSRDDEVIRLVDKAEAGEEGATRVLIASKVGFDLDELFVIDTENKILFQNTPDLSVIKNEEFKKMAEEAFETKVRRGVMINSASSGEPVFYLAFPILGETRRGLLIIGKIFDHKYLESLFPTKQRGIIIFPDNPDGRIAASADSKIFEEALGQEKRGEIVSRTNEEGEYLYKVKTRDFTGLIKVTNLRYNTFLVGMIGYVLDTSEGGRLQSDLVAVGGITAMVITITLAITLIFLRRWIVYPVAQIKYGFEKLIEGDYEVYLESEGLEEISQIKAAFNQTTGKLRDTHRHLEEKIAERTKELNEKLSEMEKMNSLMVGRELKMMELKKEIENLRGER